MVDKITFIEYVNSKEQLRTAVKKDPQTLSEYTVTKYCKLVVVENSKKEYVALSPQNTLIVEWLYSDDKNPTPLSLRVEGSKKICSDAQHTTPWKGDRLLKWLIRNTNNK